MRYIILKLKHHSFFSYVTTYHYVSIESIPIDTSRVLYCFVGFPRSFVKDPFLGLGDDDVFEYEYNAKILLTHFSSRVRQIS